MKLEDAFIKACDEGTKKVFCARLNLVGYWGAGKTSLAKRLMGKNFKENVCSTEGVSVHRIESTFNMMDQNCDQWDEKTLDLISLLKDFRRGVLSLIPETSDIPDFQENDLYKEEISQSEIKFTDDELLETSHESVIFSQGKLQEESNIEDFDQTEGEISKIASQEITMPLPSTNEQKAAESQMEGLSLTHEIRDILEDTNLTVDQESDENPPFSIILWDLGGQNEFIASHHLFLNIESTILIVMRINDHLNDFISNSSDCKPKLGYLNKGLDVLRYWLHSFDIEAKIKGKNKPNIALVLTHKDKIEAKSLKMHIEEYKERIIAATRDYPQYITRDTIYVVNNAATTDSDFIRLRNHLLKHLTEQETWGSNTKLTWLKLKADMIKLKNEKKKYMKFEDVRKLAMNYGIESAEARSFLKQQNDLGEFIYHHDSYLKDTIILDPQWLADKCKQLITTNDFIDKRKHLKSEVRHRLKNGRVTEDDLREVWNDEEFEFLSQLMKNFNLLLEIGDEYLIPSMMPMSENDTDISEREPFIHMEQIYSEKYKEASGGRLLIGTFHQLLSKASKVEGWRICTEPDHLSYTSTSFDIGDSTVLTLVLSHSGKVKAKMWQDRIHTIYIKEKHEILLGVMESCGMNQGEKISIFYTLNPNSQHKLRLLDYIQHVLLFNRFSQGSENL